MTSAFEPDQEVDLAGEADFALGQLTISPSALRVQFEGRDEKVEPKVLEVLVVLAKAMPRTVSRDRLIAACWGGRVVSDDAVNRVIAKVRQLSRLTEPAAFTLETVPKVGFRLTAATGVGPATAASSQEMTEARSPHPVAPTSAVGDDASPSPWQALFRRRTRMVIAAFALVGLLVAGGVVARLASGVPPEGHGRVEVMAFRPLQDTPELAAFSVRVSNATVRYLTAARVGARNEVLTPDDGAAGSRAEFRVVGAVDHEDGRTVIDSQIIDRASGIVLWSGHYDRPIGNTAGLDEEFGATVGAIVSCATYIRRKERASLEVDVMAPLLQACGGVLSFDDSRDVTLRLARAAPKLSRSHTLVAASHLAHARAGVPEAEAEASVAIAEDAIERALKIDRTNEMAFILRASLASAKGDLLASEKELDRAVALDPDVPPFRITYFGLLRETGRIKEAQSLAQRMLESNDPREIGILPLVAFNSAMLGLDGDRDAALNRLALFRPSATQSVRSTISLWWDPAVRASDARALRSGAADAAKSADCWERYFQTLEAAQGRPVQGLPESCQVLPASWRIRLLSRQGDADGAYALLDAEPIPEPRPTQFLFYPEMKAFRADPRFMPLAKAWGLVDYWVESGHWPDFCLEPGAPYDCKAVAAGL